MEESLASSIVTKTNPPLNLVASRHFPLFLIIPAHEMHTSPNRDSKHIICTCPLGENSFTTHIRSLFSGLLLLVSPKGDSAI